MIGKKLGGRYEILALIGEGGMASAYRARDNLLNRMVAVKMLKGQLAEDEDFVRRFRREAQAAAGLAHPHIVNVFDVGEDDGNHYIVMENVEGKTLKNKILEEGSLEPEKAVNIMLQITEAIQHAHASQVIHRDIKPQNILISNDGQVKVTDFGIALAANASQTITCGEQVMGSVHYFSPEQARGGVVEEQSDVYSLGIVFYEMLTGEIPFSGESPISIALKHLNEEITPLREVVPHLPEELEKIILKAVQKNPYSRYSSVTELKEDLNLWKEEGRVYHAWFLEEDGNLESTQVRGFKIDNNLGGETGGTQKESVMNSKNNVSRKKAFWKKAWFVPLVLVVILLGVLTGGFFYLFSLMTPPAEVEVPDLEGMSKEEALEELEKVGLENVETDEQHHLEIEEGYMISQSPDAGRTVREQREVTLMISKGVQEIEVPDLSDKTEREARYILENKGMEMEIEKETHEDISEGYVIRQDPHAGFELTPGDKVTVYVSTGSPPTSLDDLTGKTRAEAHDYLSENGFILGEEDKIPSDDPEGKVIDQHPAPGSPVEHGDFIDLVISEGPEEEEEEEDEEEDDNNENGEEYGENGEE